MTAKAAYRVPLSKKIAYAMPAFFLAVVGIPVYVYIPKFYTDVVGVNIAALGYILFSVRIFDAFTDPAFGYISDRTPTALHRGGFHICGPDHVYAVCPAAAFCQS